MKGRIIAASAVAWAYIAGAAYVWPSQYDEIEDILSLQTGYRSRGFVDGVTPCSFGGNINGRQFAAEWIRTAFHDVATTDAAAGQGGLDGSIWFEVHRSENGGVAFNNTFSFFANLYSARASASDLLAMSVVVANAGCGGVKMPFRAGRIDAQEAGPAGVPEPHTPLNTTMSRFAGAGFSQTEMIELVACGHTLGGVHSVNNPDIVNMERTPDTVTHFDGTFDAFDNKIATEYLDGTTTNPLVVNSNATINSDKRIFASDGNKTITELGGSGFRAACADVFTRMIDTVPSSVTLTDPIEPVDIKPYISMALSDDGNIALSGWVRVQTTEGTGRSTDDLVVSLVYSDRDGSGSTVVSTALDDGGTSTGLHGETFVWYQFSTPVDAARGVSKFNIHLTTPSNNATTVYENGGSGYPVNDALLYLESESCVNRTSVNNERTFTVTAAVRKDRSSDPVAMDVVHLVRRQGVIVRKLEVETVDLAATGDERGEYVVFAAQTQLATSGWSTSFDLVLGGAEEVKVEFLKTQACPRT
ncbi:WSC domain-containing protein [Colletotrichum karsti]|uniref:Peroxidase n=1 Tax=Colletotrichum karsti TaxID=1095194 RepID=A0A9P6ICD7_9PEZI|nr:WSC domain-containing protein [Colletotrichum karsti]KAF9879909.1 WSC domain-containing protein [Colletotrichum karsti]